MDDTCQNLMIKEAIKKSKAKKVKEWNKEKKVRKEALKTLSEYKKELQVIFNKFIRLRDKGLNCISCNKPAKKENAGHYRSVGGNPELRFEELNKKIGIKKVEWLEGKHDPKHYTIEQIKGLKVMYRLKIKQLEK